MSFLSFVILYFLIGLVAIGIMYICDEDNLLNIRNDKVLQESLFLTYIFWIVFFLIYLLYGFVGRFMRWYINLLENICIAGYRIILTQMKMVNRWKWGKLLRVK